MNIPLPSEKLLDRFIAGECSPAEQKQVESWIADDPARARRFEQLPSLLVAQSGKRDWDVDTAYATVQSRINPSNRKIDVTPAVRVFTAPWAHWQVLVIAAVVIIVIAIVMTVSSGR